MVKTLEQIEMELVGVLMTSAAPIFSLANSVTNLIDSGVVNENEIDVSNLMTASNNETDVSNSVTQLTNPEAASNNQTDAPKSARAILRKVFIKFLKDSEIGAEGFTRFLKDYEIKIEGLSDNELIDLTKEEATHQSNQFFDAITCYPVNDQNCFSDFNSIFHRDVSRYLSTIERGLSFTTEDIKRIQCSVARRLIGDLSSLGKIFGSLFIAKEQAVENAIGLVREVPVTREARQRNRNVDYLDCIGFGLVAATIISIFALRVFLGRSSLNIELPIIGLFAISCLVITAVRLRRDIEDMPAEVLEEFFVRLDQRNVIDALM